MADARRRYTAAEAAALLVQSDTESDLESEWSESEEETDSDISLNFIGEEDIDQVGVITSQSCDSTDTVEIVVSAADNIVVNPVQDVASDNPVPNIDADKLDDVAVTNRAPSKRKTTPAVATTWSQVVGGHDASLFDFEFKPHSTPGVSDEIDENCTVFEAFTSIFTDEMQDLLVHLINDFAFLKNQINNPPKKHSIAQTWVPVTKYELLKFIAVITSMGLDKRPWVRDYWSQKPHLQTPWYSKMFTRSRFEAIFFMAMFCFLYFQARYCDKSDNTAA